EEYGAEEPNANRARTFWVRTRRAGRPAVEEGRRARSRPILRSPPLPTPGYYRFPAIHRDTLVFVSEDDLWTIPAEGGVARRLTASPGTVSFPFFSRDGAVIAFTGREEGHSEVYTLPSDGGPVRRVTYLGGHSMVVGWSLDGGRILFSSDAGQPFGV